MRDEYFQHFIKRMGEGEDRVEVPEDVLAAFDSKLPPQLLSYWRDEGWAAYADGLFWTVNPSDYREVLDRWLAGTRLESHAPVIHVIARTAFGDLYLLHEGYGPCGNLSGPTHSVYVREKKLKSRDEQSRNIGVQSFFLGLTPADVDFENDSGQRMFKLAKQQLGALGRDSMYAFRQPLSEGGTALVDNLEVKPIRVHLLALRALRLPRFPLGR